jgi:hypothetical protein
MASFNKVIEQIGEDILDRKAKAVMGEAQNLAATRLKVKTGKYRGSFKIVKSRLKREVVNTAPHALYVEKGTRPHTIKAKEKSLRFNVGNRTVYAKQVRHPGTKPRNILKDALRSGIRKG